MKFRTRSRAGSLDNNIEVKKNCRCRFEEKKKNPNWSITQPWPRWRGSPFVFRNGESHTGPLFLCLRGMQPFSSNRLLTFLSPSLPRFRPDSAARLVLRDRVVSPEPTSFFGETHVRPGTEIFSDTNGRSAEKKKKNKNLFTFIFLARSIFFFLNILVWKICCIFFRKLEYVSNYRPSTDPHQIQ